MTIQNDDRYPVLTDLINKITPATLNEAQRQANETARQAAEVNRETSVNAIKSAYDAATKANLSVEVSNARGSKTTLKDRLDNVDTTLSDLYTKQGDLTQLNTTDKSSIVNALKEIKLQSSNNSSAISNMGNATPKGVYATVTALQTAFPSGTTGIYVVTADGGWYYWSGSAWTKGGTYQSTAVADNSITPSKTNFMQRLTNLYDKTKATNGSYIVKTTGLPTALGGFAYSDYIPIMLNTTYTFTNDNPQQYGAIYDINKNYLAALPDGACTGSQRSITITTTNAAFIRFNLPSSLINTYIMSEGTTLQGSSTTESIQINNLYSADNATPGKSIKDNTILATKAQFITQPYSLFKASAYTKDYFTRNDTGVTQAYTGYATSDYIPVVNGKTYVFSDDYPQNYGAIFDADKNYIAALPNGTIADGGAVAPKTITINNSKAAFIRFNFQPARVAAANYMMIQDTVLPASYMPYSGIQVPELRLINDNISSAVLAYLSQQIGSNRWMGKKIVFDGDSITDGQVIQGDTLKTTYPNLVAQALQCTALNHAKSGATICTTSNTRNIVNCVGELETSADLVYIAGGVNDWRYFPANLGDTNSTDISTFWGALNNLMQQLVNKYPNIPIVFATPIHNGIENSNNSFGYKLIDYVNAIKQACAKYGILCCDMYNLFGYSPVNLSVRSAVFYPDDTHPYTHVGLQEMANRVVGFLRSI